MDLQTIKSKFADYLSVIDIVNDIRLVWDNCRLFNEPGSELFNLADDFSKEFENFVEVLFFNYLRNNEFSFYHEFYRKNLAKSLN